MGLVSPIMLREALACYPTGVTVVTVKVGGEVHGATVASFMGVSLSPPIVMTSLRRESRLAQLIEGRPFAVSLLAHDQGWLARHFSGQRSTDHVPWTPANDMLIDGATAHVTCVHRSHQIMGDHAMTFGLVADVATSGKPPLLYHKGNLHEYRPDKVTLNNA